MTANEENNLIYLEAQLANAKATDFPNVTTDMKNNTKPYPEKYGLLKTNLSPKHDLVGIMATLKSLEIELKNNSLNNETHENIFDYVILLNNHGKGHVETVISRAGELSKCIKNEASNLRPFEIFILLCAIQIHDIGNMFGRDDHTVSFFNDFKECANKSFIKESSLIRCIFDIARAHSGKILGSLDTIIAAELRNEASILGIDVRQRLLAAILRFADELADDYTRVIDYIFTDMPEYSKIYHAYSGSLHTVKVEKLEKENVFYIKLCYDIPIKDAFCIYKKLKKDDDGNYKIIELTLIMEIIERTKKMERERRYCSRHFLPYFLIKYISVEIRIDLGSIVEPKKIIYTLEDTGYPSEEIPLSPDIYKSIDELEKINKNTGGESNE